jgi:nucleoside-diphosphate-sugar epimerase
MEKKNKKKNTLLILGGTGFIGKNLCEYARKKNFTVISASKNFPKKKIAGISYFRFNLKNIKSLKNILKEKIDYVINCSGYINHKNGKNNRKEMFLQHFDSVKKLVHILKKKKIKKFINLGSSDEYGNINSPIKEDAACKPLTFYSFYKLCSAKFLSLMWKKNNFPATTLRLFLAYGPHQKKERVIPYIILKSIKKEKYFIYNGNQKKDFCHIDDICKAILKCLVNKKTNGEIINIASGVPITIKSIADRISKLTNFKGYSFLKKDYRKTENIKLWADIKKAEKIIGWKPKINLDTGLKKLILFYENNN